VGEEGRKEIIKTKIFRFHEGESYPGYDEVAREDALEIRLNGQTLVYLMRLPGDDRILAAGFCLSEGIIRDPSQIELIHSCEDDEAFEIGQIKGEAREGKAGNLVEIRAKIEGGDERFRASRVVRTGCGGADLKKEIDLEGIHITSDVLFHAQTIINAPKVMLGAQGIFRETGGTHGAGIFDNSGRMLVVKEDIGRHNAIDKVLGYLLLSGEPTDDKGLVISGRLSYEMVLKAARARIPLICSISAPTSLGVEVGRITGVTLVGFTRGASFNVYSNEHRIGGV